MNEAEILNWMVEHKYARNEFAARHTFEGLELNTVPTFWARAHRVILYREWRDSQEFGKVTAACFVKAIAGERVGKLRRLRAEAEAIF